MTLTQSDRLQLQRHLDGALDAAAAAAFAARLLAEPQLARAADEARTQRDLLRRSAGPGLRPSPRFAAGVVAAARALPSRQQLEQSDLVAGAIGVCRRVLLAAACVAAVGALWHLGLVGSPSPTTLQASASEAEQEIRRLDERIQSGAVPPPVGGQRR
jgi:anti-sigma factor RsiW